MPPARPLHILLALAILPLAGSLACANRGMQAPSDGSVVGTGSGGGSALSLDGSTGSGAGGIAGAGGMTGSGGAGGANAGGGGLANTGGAGVGNRGGGGGGANAGGGGGTNTGGGGGQTNTGGAAGTNAGGHGGQTNTGGAGGVNTGGSGGANGGGAGRASVGGAGGQILPALFAYYPFDQTAGPAIPHASGNGHGGTLVGTATFPAGVIGNDLSLPGASGDYVALPSGLFQTMTNVTIALWVNVRADQPWQRVFDFGSSMNVYMFLTPHVDATSIARFSITTKGNAAANEQNLDAPEVLPVGTWTHVAIVLGTGGGTFYINGAAVGTNAALTLRPADLGATTNNWLGRSEFTGDPAFNGQIDDLRIYASALTAAQITAIYNAR